MMYYASDHTWNRGNTKFLGVTVLQNPMDLWNMQEIIAENKPDIIIETGTADGGSSLFYAVICDALGLDAGIITIDINAHKSIWRKHPRIKYLVGASINKQLVERVRQLIPSKAKVMVILDSDHNAAYVLAEMETYGVFVTPGQYMIIEDSNIGGNPVTAINSNDPGPASAIATFLKHHNEFELDEKRNEKFFLTFHPGGWLKKVR